MGFVDDWGFPIKFELMYEVDLVSEEDDTFIYAEGPFEATTLQCSTGGAVRQIITDTSVLYRLPEGMDPVEYVEFLLHSPFMHDQRRDTTIAQLSKRERVFKEYLTARHPEMLDLPIEWAIKLCIPKVSKWKVEKDEQ